MSSCNGNLRVPETQVSMCGYKRRTDKAEELLLYSKLAMSNFMGFILGASNLLCSIHVRHICLNQAQGQKALELSVSS